MESTLREASIYPRQPSGSIIHVHEATAARLVLDLPPGKGSAGIGLFAVIWNGFMLMFTTLACVALAHARAPNFGLAPVLFFGFFWCVGFGFIYAWIKLRFERCFLLVDHERAVLRRMLLGRQRQTELPLDEFARAKLTESYQENHRPVYRVTVTGAGGEALHFGTALDQADKDWCVDAINALLNPPSMQPLETAPALPPCCESCGMEFPGDAFRAEDGDRICPECGHHQALALPAAATEVSEEAVSAEPLPEELPGIVTIHSDSPERLELSVSWTEFSNTRWTVIAIAAFLAILWCAFTGGSPLTQWVLDPPAADPVTRWASLIFAIPALLGIAAAGGLVAIAAWGRLTTRIDPERLRIRFHVGPFAKTWTMETADITAVRITNRQDFPSIQANPRVATPQNQRVAEFHAPGAAAVFSGRRVLAMTLIHAPLTTRFVVETVRAWLLRNVPAVKFSTLSSAIIDPPAEE